MTTATRTAESDEERARRKEREARGPGARAAALAVRILSTPLVLVPAPVAFFVARRLGEIAWALFPERRRVAADNLRLAFGDLHGPRERRRIGRESARRFAMTIVEGLLLPGWIARGRLAGMCVESAGAREAFERHRRGEPIVFFTGHLGAWEVGARHLVRRGWRIGLPYRSTKNEVLQDWIVRTRAIAGPEQFPRKGALRPLLRLLKEGAAVTMFLDQNERDGVFVEFFGRPAATVPTVGLLAERTGAAVYYQAARRVRSGREYRIQIDGPLSIPPGGTEEERIRAWTQVATKRIEDEVRLDPADWLWVHRRWRTQPPGE